MIIERLCVGPLQTNCYILKHEKTGIIIDPGDEPEKIIDAVSGLKISLILVTHNHFDHLSAVKEVKKTTGAKAAIHQLDWSQEFDIKLYDGQEIKFSNERIKVLHTPGHTSGSSCFLLNYNLFSGDTLFSMGWGRTYSLEDEKVILRSIREKLLILPDEIKVYPGHGPSTTIGEERGLY